jgi:hypothetical protein
MSAQLRVHERAALLTLTTLGFVWLAIARVLLWRRLRSVPFNQETSVIETTTTMPASADDQPLATAPAIDPAQIVGSVVQTVQSHPAVAPSHAAGVITDILAGLYQAQPAIFAVSRAGARTQAQVSLGLGLAEIIVGAFLRRSA